MQEYLFILITLALTMIISIILFCVSYLLVPKNYDSEKVSPYECGFDPFSDTRTQFEIRFYLVALLFIIFDVEIIFLFPWAVNFYKLGFFGSFIMFIFLLILLVGFIYEWVKGALDWE